MKRMTACVGWLALLVPIAASAQTKYSTGREILEAVHDRHHAGWHETLTFVQRTIIHRTDGAVDTTTWYEAEAPGRLRIDAAPIESGNGYLFREGQRYTFEGGRQTDVRPAANVLLMLVADLYHFPVERTAAALDSLGFDLTRAGETSWKDRRVLVVGADGVDTTSNQVWMDAERLLPVRMIRRAGAQGQIVVDAHIGEWARHEGSWVEGDVRIHVNGDIRQEERYSQIRVNVPLSDSLWDPEHWTIDRPYWAAGG
ncbi:MAG: hypothetical protein PVF05_01610 [Gemmatimonadales bacterium]